MTPRQPTSTVVCFDLGGVVVRICRSWEQACARAAVTLRDPDRFHAPDLTRRRRQLVEAYQTGAITCDDFFPALADATGGLHTPEEVRAVHDAWIIDDYPGIAALIDTLNATPGLVTACLSNTNHAHWAGMLGLPGGRGWRSHPVSSLQVHGASQLLNASKPGSEIYRRGEALFGAEPAQIIFFDDLEENIAAARSLGWRAHRIDHEADTAAQIRDALHAEGVTLSA